VVDVLAQLRNEVIQFGIDLDECRSLTTDCDPGWNWNGWHGMRLLGMKRDLSVSLSAANVYILVVLIPTLVLLVIPYTAMWGLDSFFDGLYRFAAWGSFLPVILIGVPIHELIHGLTWVWVGKISFGELQFGVRALTPYAHCKVPITAQAYRIGGLMPALLLGMLPYAIGLISGKGWFTSLGLVFIFAAGGDLLVLWTLRGVSGKAWVEDHPSRVGCYVMEEKSG
jgi:hypothetical protein